MALKIVQEKITPELKDGFMKLAQKHWEEIATYKDIPIDIDWEVYEGLEEIGLLRPFMAYSNGELVGYAVFILNNNPHYQTHVYAHQDIFFVRKDKRHSMAGIGLRLVAVAESVLKEEGVTAIQHHVNTNNDWSAFIEKLGYNFTEKIYEKRLN